MFLFSQSFLTWDYPAFLSASSCFMSPEKRRAKRFGYSVIFCGRGIPIWLKVGNTVYGKPENEKYKFLLVLILLGFFLYSPCEPNQDYFVTENIKDSALSACVANGIPLKMINQAVACFALEGPWRDKLTTKVIKSSQIQFILLTFKKYEESRDF